MVIKPIKPLNEWHLNKIQKDVMLIRSINNPDLYTKKIIALNVHCVMCAQILNQLAKSCIQAAKCLDIAILERHHRNDRSSHYQVFKIKKISYYKKLWLGLKTITKIGLFLLLPIIALLFWVNDDPYKNLFCRLHFGFRPIKKEQIRRWIIYFIYNSIWLVVLFFLFWSLWI